MATVQMSHVDLECGGGGGSFSDDDCSVCFSDAEEGSCYSQFYSTADGDGSHDDDDEILEAMESQRVSSVADSDCSVVLEHREVESKSHLGLGKQERDCRICHLSLETSGPESGIPMELGCSCKDDLAAAHKHCAEAWFKIKGNNKWATLYPVVGEVYASNVERLIPYSCLTSPQNSAPKICEICNSIARNVVGANENESGQQTNDNPRATNAASEQGESMSETRRRCLDGRFLNFLLACLVFAFVLSWLFHFNIRS